VPVTVLNKGVPDPSRVLPREGGCFDSLSPPTIQTPTLSHKSRQGWGTPDSSVLADKILDGIFKFS
jgi:hypothetical protein